MAAELVRNDRSNYFSPGILASSMRLFAATYNHGYHMQQSKRWPLKADYRNLKRADAITLVYAYADTCGLENLRKHGNFRTIGNGCLDPVGFGRHDLYCALQVLVDEVNAAPGDEHLGQLGARLSRCLGPLDKPIAITLLGRGTARDSFVIEPHAWFKARLH